MAYGLFTSPVGRSPRGLTVDEEYRIRNNNPFAPVTTLIGSPSTQVAPTFADLGRAMSWQDLELQKVLRGPSGGLAQFAGPTPSNLTGVGMPANPFTTLRNTKNPSVQSSVDSALGLVNALPTDVNVNTNVVKANVKDPATAARIGSAGARFDADVNNTRQSFADFVKNFSANLASSQKQLETESTALDPVYDTGPGGLEAKLAAMANARRLAVTTAAQRAMRTAGARGNSARLLGGDSSYLDAQELDAMSGIGAEAAKEKADLDRLNLLGVLDARSRLFGARGNASMNLAQRGLLPVQASQQLAGNELAQLTGLSNLTNQNTFFNLDNPEQLLARRLGLLGQVSQLDLANNFYGLQKPYEPSTDGMLPIGGTPRSRGRFDFPSLDAYGGDMGYGGGPSLLPHSPGAPAPQNNPLVTAARRLYMQQTGVDPASDPNFSQESWNAIMQQLQPPPIRPVHQSSPGYNNPFEFPELNPNAVAELQGRFAMRPESFYGPDAYDWRRPDDVF